jgi:hypothetical protein
MKYQHVNGPVYCRYAITPPVINSELAHQFGIEAPTVVELQEGSNVKLRLLLQDGKMRVTCHAKIDWVKKDDRSGEYKAGLGQLSLTDPEFKVLLDNLVDEPEMPLHLGKTVRAQGTDSEPVLDINDGGELKRIKAVTLPVSLIEMVDTKRGTIPFSEYIALAIQEYTSD